jgi:predicted RNA binding protein YcfA (HicA-like mRNA interferase family)
VLIVEPRRADLKAAASVLDRVRGSHHVFKHPDRAGSIVVPHPTKDLGGVLVAAIRKQAGLKEAN